MRFGKDYQASRVDANQPEIVDKFRKLGYYIIHLHSLGGGVFDLLVCKHNIAILVEVKDGSRVPSARMFTKPQRIFNFSYPGLKCVAKCTADVLNIDAQVRGMSIAHKTSAMAIVGCKDPIYRLSLY